MDENESEIEKNIKELEELAEKVRTLKKDYRQRRPIVIEFCGAPKSGKTSCISSLNLFLKRNGFKTGVIAEQASICPIKDKHSPVFNVWTANSTIGLLCSMLDPRRNDQLDIIICDRAVFDALCWFKWMLFKGTLDSSEYQCLTDYISMARWANKIDLVYIFKASPEISIKREYAHLLTRKPGSIMNQKILAEYLKSIELAKEDFGDRFRMVQEIDTTEIKQDEVSAEVTRTILHKLEELIIEKVGFVDKNVPEIQNLFAKEGVNNFKWLEKMDIPLEKIEFNRRDEVERNNKQLQFIPIGVLTNPEHSRVLILKKQPDAAKNSAEKNAYLTWFGGHMREEDKINGLETFEEVAKVTLKRETEEELGISISLDSIKPYYLYSTAHEKSTNHLAICFLIEKDLDNLKLSINTDELLTNKGTSKSGTFIDIEELKRGQIGPFEEWSKIILSKLFGAEIEFQNEQMAIPFSFDDRFV